jgi:hypothetical protein
VVLTQGEHDPNRHPKADIRQGGWDAALCHFRTYAGSITPIGIRTRDKSRQQENLRASESSMPKRPPFSGNAARPPRT